MAKMWLIAERHFRKEVVSRGFLVALLSLPLFLGLSAGLGMLAENLRRTEPSVIGYVDHAGIVAQFPPAGDVEAEFVAIASADMAKAALEAGTLDAYYVLPAGYPATRQAELIYRQPPHRDVSRYFEQTLRFNLVDGQPPADAERALAGTTIDVYATTLGRLFPSTGPSPDSAVPAILGMLVGFGVMMTATVLMGALVEEKENRTMEVLVTSVSPGTMMAGKIVGSAGMGVLLFAAWVALLVVAWLVGSLLGVEWLQTLQVPWGEVGLLALVAVPTVVCISAGMTLLGTTLVSEHEAHQFGPLMFIVLLVPIYVLPAIGPNPNGALAIVFSLFPFTSLMTFGIRGIFTVVPAWHYLAAAGIALLAAAGLVWLAGRAVRLSMLRYGQRLSPRALLRAGGA